MGGRGVVGVEGVAAQGRFFCIRQAVAIVVPAEPGWIARHVALDYESGFRISSAASYGKHRFDLRLRGPVYETPLRARNYGVMLELEF